MRLDAMARVVISPKAGVRHSGFVIVAFTTPDDGAEGEGIFETHIAR